MATTGIHWRPAFHRVAMVRGPAGTTRSPDGALDGGPNQTDAAMHRGNCEKEQALRDSGDGGIAAAGRVAMMYGTRLTIHKLRPCQLWQTTKSDGLPHPCSQTAGAGGTLLNADGRDGRVSSGCHRREASVIGAFLLAAVALPRFDPRAARQLEAKHFEAQEPGADHIVRRQIEDLVQAHGNGRQAPHVEIDGGDLPQGQVHQGQVGDVEPGDIDRLDVAHLADEEGFHGERINVVHLLDVRGDGRNVLESVDVQRVLAGSPDFDIRAVDFDVDGVVTVLPPDGEC